MSWLSNLFGGEEEEERIVCVEADTEAESIERGRKLLAIMHPADKYEQTREDEFFCGLCGGWVPISQFATHSH